jgi:glycosyltransferase involved in cell wall biosynthesis
MRILFITRKYPPSIGGMEKVSYELAQSLGKQTDITVIAWGGSQKFLPFFLAKAFFLSLWQIPTKKITHIHLGDGVLAPFGLVLGSLTRKPVSVTIHGLDITYKKPLFQKIIPGAVRQLNSVICISEATKAECVTRGIDPKKITVIPWGVNPKEFEIEATREDLEKIAGMSLEGKTVLITVGRLVKRKGVAWFVEEVIPRLDDSFVYLVAGDGSEREAIQEAIAKNRLDSRVKLLGKVSEESKKILYKTSDAFVMPNIHISGDMEGFGMVAIEASSAGLPIIASNLEGIRDAIISNQTGLLVSPEKSIEFINALKKSKNFERVAVANTSKNAFNWTNVAKKYAGAIYG